MKKLKLFVLSLSLMLCFHNLLAKEISNGYLKITIDEVKGTFDIVNQKSNEIIVKQSLVGFQLADYVDLCHLEENQIETDVNTYSYWSSEANIEAVMGGKYGEAHLNSTLSLVSRIDSVGELDIEFTLFPHKSYVQIGFSFRNLGDDPIRLRQVTVVNSNNIFPGLNTNEIFLLGGDSGAKDNYISTEREMNAENNILLYIPNGENETSLVAGGLYYHDYRKYVDVNNDSFILKAEDPVGRRIDPGQIYSSLDKFYLDGSISNPFEALEMYAKIFKETQNISINYYTFPSTCLWFLSVGHFGNDTESINNTVGAVREMDNIKASGFLKYSPVAVRLVPDNYEQNNQQGWWDNEHWQMYGQKTRDAVERHYEKPYETTQKWATAVIERGGIPFTYFQPGIRSEDYAIAYPEHMLYNKSHKYILVDGKIVGDPHSLMGTEGWRGDPGFGKMWQESYDYTDPGFTSRFREVNQNLRNGGVKGIFYDYPRRAFPERGGMENRYATATYAYINTYRIAREELGKNAFLQERMGIGSDATLGFVSSNRTVGDNNIISNEILSRVALRWYKNRTLVNYDMDGKSLLFHGQGQDDSNAESIGSVQRKSILTLSYAVSGRLLLTESFKHYSPEVLYDLGRVYPFHATTLSARPLDMFINKYPTVFDMPVSEDWHQLILYNNQEKGEMAFDVPLSGSNSKGAIGLNPLKEFYVYDFWNNQFVGKIKGDESIKQVLSEKEARVLSIHTVKNNPQWISTNRHIMQGYVDLVKKPHWKSETNTLSGVSAVVGGEPYVVTLALNGYVPKQVLTDGDIKAGITIHQDNSNLADLIIEVPDNTNVDWTIEFE
jgi:hypothetical protein